jgi:hypothetical protein
MIIKCPSEIDYQNNIFEWWGQTRLVVFPVSNSEIAVSITLKMPETGLDKTSKIVISQIGKACSDFKGSAVELVIKEVKNKIVKIILK